LNVIKEAEKHLVYKAAENHNSITKEAIKILAIIKREIILEAFFT